MERTLIKKWNRLKEYLEMIPVPQDNSFRIEAINSAEIESHGLMNNDILRMDWVFMGKSVETRWTIQDKGIHFLVNQGKLDLHFRLNDNIHIKHLSVQQSIRIPPGIPFMLKTYEVSCSLLLISSKEKPNDG